MKKRKWLIAVGIMIALGVAVWFVFDIGHWEKLDMEKLRSLSQRSVFYDAEDKKFATLAGAENRQVVSLGEVPGEVQLAFLAAEDARFYSHPGVDFYRIGGAIVSDIKSGSYGQGASTITQQLIKLTHLTSAKELSRKAQEAVMALILETRATKEEILTDYLNVVYFGNGAYGIEAAAQSYFGIHARDLSLEQGALLAAIIKSPTNYAPHLYPENALKRRNLVLESMEKYEFISPEEAESAKKTPIEIIEPEKQALNYGWYVDAVSSEAESILGITPDEFLSGGYAVYTTLDASLQQSAEALFEDNARFPANAKDGTPAQSALVALDVSNGEVLALVGGRSYDVRRGLNRATQIRRQPGSAFKPISVYAAAVDRFGYLPSSFIDDTQRDFGGGYTPRNVNDQYRGAVTLREALARSLNVATVDLLSRTDIATARQYAESAGVHLDANDNNLSLALGSLTYGVSPMEICAAYAPLANGGASVTPHLIREIKDSNGNSLYRFNEPSHRVMSPESAYMITDMLRSAADWGSASALSNLNFDVAGKTGTVAMNGGGNRDAWTVGYTPSISVAVWMGFDEPDEAHKLPNSSGGSAEPARLVASLLSAAKDLSASMSFAKPSGLTEVMLDGKALTTLNKPMLASDLTPKSLLIKEIFPIQKAPTQISSIWRAPLSVSDLSLGVDGDGLPMITFTALQADAMYLLYREVDGQESLAAELSGLAGEQMRFSDAAANPGKRASYSVIPVQKDLYAEQKTLAGTRSASVRYEPGIQWFYNLLEQDTAPMPTPTPEPTSLPEGDDTPILPPV